MPHENTTIGCEGRKICSSFWFKVGCGRLQGLHVLGRLLWQIRHVDRRVLSEVCVSGGGGGCIKLRGGKSQCCSGSAFPRLFQHCDLDLHY